MIYWIVCTAILQFPQRETNKRRPCSALIQPKRSHPQYVQDITCSICWWESLDSRAGCLTRRTRPCVKRDSGNSRLPQGGRERHAVIWSGLFPATAFPASRVGSRMTESSISVVSQVLMKSGHCTGSRQDGQLQPSLDWHLRGECPLSRLLQTCSGYAAFSRIRQTVVGHQTKCPNR